MGGAIHNSWTSVSQGLTIGGGSVSVKETMTMAPGIYVFDGTAIELVNSSSRITGTGVFMYFMGNPSQTYFHPKTGIVNLIAPSAGTPPYPDWHPRMVIWIDNCSIFDSQGNSAFYVEGIFYAPCSTLYLHGNPYGDAIRGQVIAAVIDIRGNVNFHVSYEDYVATLRYELWLIE